MEKSADKQPVGEDNSGNTEKDAGGGSVPDGSSALMLVAARLRHIAGTNWGDKRCLDMCRPEKQKLPKKEAA